MAKECSMIIVDKETNDRYVIVFETISFTNEPVNFNFKQTLDKAFREIRTKKKRSVKLWILSSIECNGIVNNQIQFNSLIPSPFNISQIFNIADPENIPQSAKLSLRIGCTLRKIPKIKSRV